MLRVSRGQLHPIGIDIGRDSVKALQIEVAGRALRVRAADRASLPQDCRGSAEHRIGVAIDIIQRMLREAPFSGRKVVMALPRESVQIKSVRLPMMPAAELEQAVRFEASQLFAFDVEAGSVQFIPAGEVRQGTDVLQEVIILAAAPEDVGRFVEQVHAGGLVIDSLDVESCALFRSAERFVRRREDEQEVHVLVDIGLGGTQVVVGKGREISFLKMIDIGGSRFQEAISRKLGIPLEEAQSLRRRLAETPEASAGPEKKDPVRQAVFDATRSLMEQLGRELMLCLRYYSVTFRGHRPHRVRLYGGEATDRDLRHVLSTMLSLPVEAGRPLQNLDCQRVSAEDRPGPTSEWAVALGLALRHTDGRFAPKDGLPRGSITIAADIAPTDLGEDLLRPSAESEEVAHA